MQTLPAIDRRTTTGETKAVLERVEQHIGWVPKMITLLANSPAATEAYLQFNLALARAALPRHTRSLIAATVAELNGCTYSAMIARGQAREAGVPEEAVAAARGARSKDPKVAAALLFVAKLIEQRGKLPPAEVAGLRSAGYSDTEIVEIVATVVLSLFRDYFNLVAGTEIEDVTKLRDTGLNTKSAES